MKNSVYTSLVLLFTISSLFKTNYSTPITVEFGGYNSSTDIALIIESDNDQRIKSSILYKNDHNFVHNYSSFLVNSNFLRLHKVKLNKYLFPQKVCVNYIHPFFIKSRLNNKVINQLQLYQDESLPHIS
ncbi:MAG: hypothetical protein P8Y99_09625 [Calditrichaceae bacterium]